MGCKCGGVSGWHKLGCKLLVSIFKAKQANGSK